MKKILNTCMITLLCFFMLTGCGKSESNDQFLGEKFETDAQQTEVPKRQDVTQENSNKPTNKKSDVSYFNDAIFIGNSRTEGLRLFGGLNNAKYLSHAGLMVDTVFTEPYFDGDKTAMEVLSKMDFSKVYLMLGINELGWSYPQIFKKDYGLIIDEIRKVNPNVIIYIQSILPVTIEKSATDAVYNMENINEFNSLLVELAGEKNVIYLDISNEISDENGYLPADGSSDGIHFNADYCKKWTEYLMKYRA